MIPTLKAEFRKLFTIRSTYFIVAIVLAITALMCFYFEGYKGNTGSPAATLQTGALQDVITNPIRIGISALLLTIIAVLFMAHEYRYNTIMYTLTANTRRTTVLLIKMLTITVFAILFGLVTSLFSIVMYKLGLHFRDATLPTQDFAVWSTFGKVLFYYVGYALIGLLLAALLRAVVGAIVMILLIPTTIEPLLSLALKDNAVYLPFAALETVLSASMMRGDLTSTGALGVSVIYIVVVGVVTWVLFLKRDAN